MSREEGLSGAGGTPVGKEQCHLPDGGQQCSEGCLGKPDMCAPCGSGTPKQALNSLTWGTVQVQTVPLSENWLSFPGVSRPAKGYQSKASLMAENFTGNKAAHSLHVALPVWAGPREPRVLRTLRYEELTGRSRQNSNNPQEIASETSYYISHFKPSSSSVIRFLQFPLGRACGKITRGWPQPKEVSTELHGVETRRRVQEMPEGSVSIGTVCRNRITRMPRRALVCEA